MKRERVMLCKKTIFFLILLISLLVIEGCGNQQDASFTSSEASSDVSSSLPGSSEILHESATDPTFDESTSDLSASEGFTLRSVVPFTADEVGTIEVQHRSYDEVKAAVFDGELAITLTNELLDLQIEEFDKKKFDPWTGGDKNYIISLTDGSVYEIVEDGSITINNTEQYLLEERKYSLSIPDDTVWHTVSKN